MIYQLLSDMFDACWDVGFLSNEVISHPGKREKVRLKVAKDRRDRLQEAVKQEVRKLCER